MGLHACPLCTAKIGTTQQKPSLLKNIGYGVLRVVLFPLAAAVGANQD